MRGAQLWVARVRVRPLTYVQLASVDPLMFAAEPGCAVCKAAGFGYVADAYIAQRPRSDGWLQYERLCARHFQQLNDPAFDLGA